MPTCAECGKKVGISNSQGWHYFCNDECKSKFQDKKRVNVMIKEMKCKCNQCGKVWHYLEDDEKKLKSQSAFNAVQACGSCCSPFSVLLSNKSKDLQREAEKLKKCPECNSTDVTITPIYHEKKS